MILALWFTAAAAGDPVPCGGDFEAWLAQMRAEAHAAGVSDRALNALDAIQPSAEVLRHDRSQAVFTQDWLTFAGRMVNAYRLRIGRQKLREHAEVFAAAERNTGVPPAVITAFWGLESDYGAVQGNVDTLTALATLAHDCRRPELFRPQLIAALRLLDRGWLARDQLQGAWAGEIGQIQLLPSDYLGFGTDGDGDGRVQLKESPADVIRTAARLIRSLGWRAGEPWLEAVTVPTDLPWEQAGVYQHWPRSHWASLGVTRADGSALASDPMPAALLLPMGRKGPAFLAYPNFDVYLEWNRSLLYASTAAYFATRLAGAAPIDPGAPEPGLNAEQIRLLQQRLVDRGRDVGAIDGILGQKTRAAVRTEQQRLGLPADAWPTPELLQQLEPGSD
ncbi:MAG: lytic murein transglycosylase [Gammaproteobacteria bacterium]|jgi:lytic murein transglycosylase|nr:lytic murein transglycosylase [Gammaproteobacteria bacterium]